MADCKLAALEIPVYGFGQAAIRDMGQALRDLTALEANVDGNVSRLVWAELSPGYVWRRRFRRRCYAVRTGVGVRDSRSCAWRVAASAAFDATARGRNLAG